MNIYQESTQLVFFNITLKFVKNMFCNENLIGLIVLINPLAQLAWFLK